ncbi:MAG: alpha-L-fucosidase [Opitutaceae bacterium]
MPVIHDLQRTRQVHLDFHTSPHIDGVAADFDPETFAATVADAGINSITIFARCHHGLFYYPTKVGAMHPGLHGRDLLGEQIEALHRRGIRCPIYTTMAWDEWTADRHPEWSQLTADGAIAKVRNKREDGVIDPGGWRYVNWLEPDYLEYIEAHVAELLDHYDVDGLFYDILSYAPDCCWSEVSRRFRAKHGLLDRSHASYVKFRVLAQNEISARLTAFVRDRAPKVSIFYNTGSFCYVDSRYTIRGRAAQQTHFEVESLPTGHWGYYHFPKLARQISYLGKPWLGQTGRFQKSWGDFGGIKPVPALEFECFRAQALGGMVEVGDQMHPAGRLDRGAYALIKQVYTQVAAAERFYRQSTACPQIGVLLAGVPGMDEKMTARSESGAVMLCEETHYDCAVIDDASDFSAFALVVLPDTTPVTAALGAKLRAYYAAGGKLLLSGTAGYDEAGNWALDFLPLQRGGGAGEQPVYWRIDPSFAPDWADLDRVIYRRGPAITAHGDARVVVRHQDQYFERTDVRFCSHFQSPPLPGDPVGPAVVLADRWACLADPVFRDYRESGTLVIAEVWRRLLEALVGPPPAGGRLPGTVLSVPRRRDDDLLLTLLHYVPVRKALNIDVIAERMGFAGEVLTFDRPVREVIDAETGQPLPESAGGGFELHGRGRLLLRVPGFFQEGV